MRKYIAGGIVGFMLAFGVSAHAEVVNMIGKVIDGAFPVKVDGKTLDSQAIVVEGTSYLPVRAFGDATGYDVQFNSDMGIILTKKDHATNAATTSTTYDPSNDSGYQRAMKAQELQKQSEDLTKQIEALSPIVTPYEIPGPNGLKPKDDTYTQAKAKRDDLIKQRDEIDQQLQEIRNQQ